jgi:hypothetical protein
MPRGPKGGKRPADVIGNAVQAMGQKGGATLGASMTPEQRAGIAKNVA